MTSWNKAFELADAKVGDRVRVTAEGVVRKSAYSSDMVIDLPGYKGWNINEDHKVTILERAKPKDTYAVNTVVEGTTFSGSKYVYVKSGTDRWTRFGSYGDAINRDWNYLMQNYDNGKNLRVLTAMTAVA